MNIEEWKQLCRKAWENDYDYLLIDRFAKIEKAGILLKIVIKMNILNVLLRQSLFDCF